VQAVWWLEFDPFHPNLRVQQQLALTRKFTFRLSLGVGCECDNAVMASPVRKCCNAVICGGAGGGGVCWTTLVWWVIL